MSWLALPFPIFLGEDCVQQCTFYHGEASVTCKKDLQQDIIFPHLSLSASRLGIHPVTSETKLQHGSPQKNASSPSHGAEWSYKKTFLRMATKWGYSLETDLCLAALATLASESPPNGRWSQCGVVEVASEAAPVACSFEGHLMEFWENSGDFGGHFLLGIHVFGGWGWRGFAHFLC